MLSSPELRRVCPSKQRTRAVLWSCKLAKARVGERLGRGGRIRTGVPRVKAWYLKPLDYAPTVLRLRTGGDGRDRTSDGRLMKAVLCQLSYITSATAGARPLEQLQRVVVPVTGSGAAQSLRPISACEARARAGSGSDVVVRLPWIAFRSHCRRSPPLGPAGSGKCMWLRERDSNTRSPGYEPGGLPTSPPRDLGTASNGVSYGSRTRVRTLKGCCPRPSRRTRHRRSQLVPPATQGPCKAQASRSLFQLS